ncbi:MAG: class I SAM-dependent methyltransferase [Polyangiaceae bacterium]
MTFDDAARRTAERYASATNSRATYHYVRGKLRGDPSTRAVFSRAPLGDVLDLGAGRGQLDVLLLEAGAATRIHGLDWDAPKIALARAASKGLDATFEVADMETATLPSADTVLMIDVLHYVDRERQDALLARALGAVRPGGRLLLREADAGRGLRSFFTLLPERIGTALAINRGERVLFRDVEGELAPIARNLGFEVHVEPCWGGTPLSNVLFVATRDVLPAMAGDAEVDVPPVTTSERRVSVSSPG